MEPFDALDQARQEFEPRLSAVKPEHWDNATPCVDWNVRHLVSHVVSGNRMAKVLLEGGTKDEALATFSDDPLGDDAMAAFIDSADAQAAAFRKPGALNGTVDHPIGEVPASMLLGFRTGDLAIHAWDLARGTGADDQLNAELVEFLWSGLSPLAPVIGRSGAFGSGPSGAVGEDAPLQIRLLDMLGRRP
jgi:uncharacterized protein (TIGR03086 family)